MMCVGHEDSESVMCGRMMKHLHGGYINRYEYGHTARGRSCIACGNVARTIATACASSAVGNRSEEPQGVTILREGAHNVTTRDKNPCSCTCLLSSSMMAQRCVEGTAAAEALL